MEMQEKDMIESGVNGTGNIRECRVGSFTFGLTMVIFGVLFLVHSFVPSVDYIWIFRCWPVVFILLGVEILIQNSRRVQEKRKFVYDFAAILMLVAMLGFAMIMAVVDYAVAHGQIF